MIVPQKYTDTDDDNYARSEENRYRKVWLSLSSLSEQMNVHRYVGECCVRCAAERKRNSINPTMHRNAMNIGLQNHVRGNNKNVDQKLSAVIVYFVVATNIRAIQMADLR